jgi:iron complex transport system ATP-binding protein
MTIELEVRDLRAGYGPVEVLHGVSLEAPHGAVTALLGPNGAGKTTLLQIAAALIHPSSGKAKLLDDRLGAVDVFELRPRIGFVSSAMSRRIPGDETVLNVVMTAAYSVTGRWNEEYEDIDVNRARRVLEEWKLGRFIDRNFGGLSDGEQKRVLIARAVMTDPELLLLDEPAASLDLGSREELLQLLSEFAKSERAPAMVMVTHHVEEIPRGFTHALLLKKGRIVAAGKLDDIVTAKNLSDTFGLPLELTSKKGRFAARAS